MAYSDNDSTKKAVESQRPVVVATVPGMMSVPSNEEPDEMANVGVATTVDGTLRREIPSTVETTAAMKNRVRPGTRATAPGAVRTTMPKDSSGTVVSKSTLKHKEMSKVGTTTASTPDDSTEMGKALVYGAKASTNVHHTDVAVEKTEKNANIGDEKSAARRELSGDFSVGSGYLDHSYADPDKKEHYKDEQGNVRSTYAADAAMAGMLEYEHGEGSEGGASGVAPNAVVRENDGDSGGEDGRDKDDGDEGDYLAVAVAIAENKGQDMFMPAAVEYDPNSKPPIHKNRRFRLYFWAGVLLLIVIGVATAVSITSLGGGNSGPSLFVTRAPTPSPTFSPTRVLEQQFRAQIMPDFPEAGDPGTIYDRAARWIMFEDPMALNPDAPNLLQRYTAALFWFMTTREGEEPWLSCNKPGPNETDSCVYKTWNRASNNCVYYIDQPGSTRWLSAASECSWAGILCDGTNVVQVIDLSEYVL